jgi:hypothetical protein
MVLNMHIEATNVQLAPTSGKPIAISSPSPSGAGQLITRCPECYTTIWSNYAGFGPYVHCVRLGTLDEGDKKGLVPDIHIYTSTRAEWFILPKDAVQSEEFYDYDKVWAPESLERLAALKDVIAKWRKEVTIFWTGKVQTLQGEELDKVMGRF